jgi:hypothetical protein
MLEKCFHRRRHLSISVVGETVYPAVAPDIRSLRYVCTSTVHNTGRLGDEGSKRWLNLSNSVQGSSVYSVPGFHTRDR